MPDLSENIEELATKPAEVSGDAGSMKTRSLKELIEADQHLKNQQAASQPHRGIRFTKLILPGAYE